MWNGTIKLPITTTVELDGTFVQRYWYHYEVDGTEDHDNGLPYARELVTGRLLNVLTISGNISSSRSLEAFPTNGRPLSVSEIKSPKPTKPIESRTLESKAHAIESMLHAPCSPKSTKPTASTSLIEDHTQDSLVSILKRLRFDTASSSSDCSTDSRCICERYGITRGGGRIKLDCGGTQCGGYWSCSDSDIEVTET